MMIRIHTLLIGQPQTLTDEQGTWRSAIFRTPVAEVVELRQRGLAGDQVADTDNHGSPDQAVCCHPLAHYAYWNTVYSLTTPDVALGPGSVGENWTLSGAVEEDLCVGDVFAVGSAQVQVSGPRYPCTKQERKVKLPAFHRRTIETLRTGWYLRVLTPGVVRAGDVWTLQERGYPDLTVHRINVCGHQTFDPVFAQRALDVPELAPVWKYIFRLKLTKQWPT
jgi:MOSC domain-containing protein YiiM